MKIFILDDMEERVDIIREFFPDSKIVWCDTVPKANELFQRISYKHLDFVFLDHDLDQNLTGLDFVKANANKLNHKMTIIHSANFEGAKKMHDLIPNALIIPFVLLVEQFVKIAESVKGLGNKYDNNIRNKMQG